MVTPIRTRAVMGGIRREKRVRAEDVRMAKLKELTDNKPGAGNTLQEIMDWAKRVQTNLTV